MCAHQGDNFVIEYLNKIETYNSGAQMGSNHEKTGGRESRYTFPLRKRLGLT